MKTTCRLEEAAATTPIGFQRVELPDSDDSEPEMAPARGRRQRSDPAVEAANQLVSLASLAGGRIHRQA